MPAPDNSSMPRHQVAGRAWDEANAWLLRVHSGLMSEQERRDFAFWRRQDVVHDIQFRQAEQFWQALNGLASEVQRTPPPREAETSSCRVVPPWSRHTWRWGAAAALIVATALAPTLWSIIEFWSADHHTRTGEHATVALTDGSLVHLNTHSALSVTLSDHRRSLQLKQGEALFEVAHDPARPFDVAVNGRVVRAIGTIFNIEHDGYRTIVSVLEGAVRLFDNKENAIEIRAGDRVFFADNQRASAPEPFSAPGVTAWRRHELIFDQMSLADIVAQMNRYRTDTIVVLDSVLRTQQITGSVALDNPAHSLELLQHTVPFHITRLTPFLTILSR